MRWLFWGILLIGLPLGALGAAYTILVPMAKESVAEFETAIARSPSNTVLYDRNGVPFYTSVDLKIGFRYLATIPHTHFG